MATPRRFGRALALTLALTSPSMAGEVSLIRTPSGGIQPQAAVDAQGVLHLVYYTGAPGAGDVFYCRSSDDGATFSQPVRVNSHPGSAVAAGNIRGAHLALGRNGRVHVAWMGSKDAAPKGPNGEFPMLYTRLNDAGTAFEPERNVMQFSGGLDGGGTVTADGQGNVWVIWHGKGAEQGEEHRRVYLARSTDDGATFAREVAVDNGQPGVCPCCGIRAMADRHGGLYILYRNVLDKVHRDAWLLASMDGGATFTSRKLGDWNANACPMSDSFFYDAGDRDVVAWESEGQVFLASIDAASGDLSPTLVAPGQPRQKRRFPLAVRNPAGDTLFAWVAGMGWNSPGALMWQVYDAAGQPTADRGRVDGVPANSLATAFVRRDGSFALLY